MIENKQLKKESQKKIQERFIHAFKQVKLIEEGKLETRDAREF